jgi:hypothetical protein
VKEAAFRLGKSEDAIYKWLRSGASKAGSRAEAGVRLWCWKPVEKALLY